MPQLCRNNFVLPSFQFHFKCKLLENTTQNEPSKTCCFDMADSADGASGKVILTLCHCRMTSALTPYLRVYGCLGFACIGSFWNFGFFGQISLYFWNFDFFGRKSLYFFFGVINFLVLISSHPFLIIWV